MEQTIRPLPNPELYPLTPEAKLEIFLSEHNDGFKKELDDFLSRYRGEAIHRTFHIDLVRDLKSFLKSYFARQGDSKITFDCYQANDRIIITISHELDWSITHHITIQQ